MKHKIVLLVLTLLLTVATAVAQGTQGQYERQRQRQRQLISTITKQVGAQSPTYVFKLYWVESFSNYHYLIEVSSEGEKRVLQSIAIRNGIRLEDRPKSFQIIDTNSDCYDDIKVLGGYKSGKAWYKVMLYDKDAHQYVWRKDSAQ